MAVAADHPQRDTPWSLQPAPRRSRRGFMFAAIIVVIVLAAIAVGVILTRHSKTAAATQPTTSAASTTTPQATTLPPTSAGGITPGDIPAAQVNPPSLAGAYSTDPVIVLRTLSTYSDWLFAHPNPAMLDNYMLPSSRNFTGVKAELTTLQTNGWHARPSVSQIVWIRADGPFGPGVGLVNGYPSYVGTIVKTVIDDTPQSSDVLNPENQVIASLHNRPQEMLGVALAQGSDGQFRISDIVAFNPPGGVAAFES
jgi:hypothetical protein